MSFFSLFSVVTVNIIYKIIRIRFLGLFMSDLCRDVCTSNPSHLGFFPAFFYRNIRSVSVKNVSSLEIDDEV